MFELLSILLQNLNPSKGTFGRPYDSTEGITAKGQLIFLLIILAFGLYVGFRVWKSFKNEKCKK